MLRSLVRLFLVSATYLWFLVFSYRLFSILCIYYPEISSYLSALYFFTFSPEISSYLSALCFLIFSPFLMVEGVNPVVEPIVDSIPEPSVEPSAEPQKTPLYKNPYFYVWLVVVGIVLYIIIKKGGGGDDDDGGAAAAAGAVISGTTAAAADIATTAAVTTTDIGSAAAAAAATGAAVNIAVALPGADMVIIPAAAAGPEMVAAAATAAASPEMVAAAATAAAADMAGADMVAILRGIDAIDGPDVLAEHKKTLTSIAQLWHLYDLFGGDGFFDSFIEANRHLSVVQNVWSSPMDKWGGGMPHFKDLVAFEQLLIQHAPFSNAGDIDFSAPLSFEKSDSDSLD